MFSKTKKLFETKGISKGEMTMKNNIKNAMNNETQKNYRLVYFYAGHKSTMFSIPVSNIYEAALVKHSLAYTDLIKCEQEVTPDFANKIYLEVFEDGCWVEWYDEYGNDDMEEWLEENEPENFAKVAELHKHFQAIRKYGEDLTLDYEEE